MLKIFHFLLLLLLHLLQAQALTSPSDISALKAFHSSIKPRSIPSWSCLASWDFAADPCAAPQRTHFICGVSCSPDATRVTQITLDPVGYSGQLTPLISRLTQLTNLDLSDNYFFGPIPSSIYSLRKLQTLTLKSNSFSGSIPDSVTTLNSLESLDLSHNSLSGNLPKKLNSLSSLRRLDLSYNKLTGFLPKLPSNLLELALRGNSLSGYLSKSSFDGLTQLEVVELGANSFSGTLGAWFFLLPSLQQVDLANNSFASVEISKPAGGNSDLVAVNLGFNRIEGNVPANLRQKKTLRRLFLDGNYLIGKPPADFFAGDTEVSGSLGDNCLRGCPGNSQLCTPRQKSYAVCKQAYGGKLQF
ncbi:STRESS ENHANCED protein 1 [Hibiscus syriacus]|uniref:STRESS ENHANCED protein 1 n=1 Tax=Hibiscus syriacus TaxID=106335 RepID=A0A6A2X0H3_HIBSY|nr:STRESS ENHANCED protein 1 [Hibiscus syriacus]